jgi:hypothetical protein
MTEQEAAAILQLNLPVQQSEIDYAYMKRKTEIRSLRMAGLLDERQANDQLWQVEQAHRVFEGMQIYAGQPTRLHSGQIGVEDLTRWRTPALVESPAISAQGNTKTGSSWMGIGDISPLVFLRALIVIVAFFMLTYWTISDFATPVRTATATVANKYYRSGKGASEHIVLRWASDTVDISVNHADYTKLSIGQRVRIDYRRYNLFITALPQITILTLDGYPRDGFAQHSTLTTLWLVILGSVGVLTGYIKPRSRWWR